MRFLSFIFLLLVAISCQKTVSPEQQAIDHAQAAYDAAPSRTSADTLIMALEAFVDVNGYADSTSARYLLKAARLSGEYRHPMQTRELYRSYLVAYASRPDQADILAEYITITEKLRLTDLNDVLYKSFIKRFPEDKRVADFQSKILMPEMAVDSFVRYTGRTMFNDSTFRLDIPKAKVYVEIAQDLVMTDPGIPRADEYLHHAAETCRTLRDVNKAIDLYDWIIDYYPNGERAATALFLKAFTLDNDLKLYEEAGEQYKYFLELYPENEFTESAQFLLDNLGRSEEELNKLLKENPQNIVQ